MSKGYGITELKDKKSVLIRERKGLSGSQRDKMDEKIEDINIQIENAQERRRLHTNTESRSPAIPLAPVYTPTHSRWQQNAAIFKEATGYIAHDILVKREKDNKEREKIIRHADKEVKKIANKEAARLNSLGTKKAKPSIVKP